MKIMIDHSNYSDYREVRRLIKNSHGEVIKTKFVMFVHKKDSIDDDFYVSCALSTSMIGKEIEVT